MTHTHDSAPPTATPSPALPRTVYLRSLAAMALLTAACSEPSAPADVDIQITATGGFGEGTQSDDGAADGLDETGVGEPMPVQDECLFNEQPGSFGYKYQCVGQFTVQILVNDLEPELLAIDFGQPDSPDSYEEPHVMACCPELDGVPCSEPHIQACVVDMVEQGCKSLVPRLEQRADERPLLRGPLLKTAEWIARASSQQACLQTFLLDTGVATTEPACDDENNSVFDFDGALEGAIWSFNPDTTSSIDHVELTLLDPEIWDAKSPTDPPEVCTSSDDNDHLSFLEIDPTIGDVKATLSQGGLTLAGPSIDGEPISAQANLSSLASSCDAPYCSRAAWSLGTSEGELHAMSFYSQQPTEIEASSELLTIDSFQFHLFAPAQGTVSKDVLSIPAGEALFVVSGQALGEHRWITAWNTTPIQIHAAQEGWSHGGFTIDYYDAAGDSWQVALAPSTWQ